MGTGPVPPGLLITPALLSRYNVPSDFLAQFAARPFQLQITTGGVLGVMAFAWQFVGDDSYSSPIGSSAITPWPYTIDSAFADLTFAAGTYVQSSTYLVDALGNVTLGTGSPIAGLSASLWDRRQTACSAASAEAMKLMRDAIRPPLMSWGDDATTHAAAMAYALLKRGVGATPPGAGDGDANIFTGETLARAFFEAIGRGGKPDDMIDNSPSLDGPLLPAYPRGAGTLRGW